MVHAAHSGHSSLPDMVVLWPHVWQMTRNGTAFIKQLQDWNMQSHHYLRILQQELAAAKLLTRNSRSEPWVFVLFRVRESSDTFEHAWFKMFSTSYPLPQAWALLQRQPFAIVFPQSLLRQASLLLWDTVLSLRTSSFGPNSPA